MTTAEGGSRGWCKGQNLGEIGEREEEEEEEEEDNALLTIIGMAEIAILKGWRRSSHGNRPSASATAVIATAAEAGTATATTPTTATTTIGAREAVMAVVTRRTSNSRGNRQNGREE